MPIFQDARFAARTLFKSPGFTAVAILTLALGIGVNTAIFTVVHAILLRPLPYPDAERMVFLTRNFPGGRGPSASVPKFFSWKRDTAGVLAHVSAYDFMGPGVSLSGAGDPEQVKAIRASEDFFALFGVTPYRGRTFTADEDRPGGQRVAVISYGLWQRRFGANERLVGSTITLSGEPFTVVGITPRSFEANPPADVWLPLQADPNSVNQGHYLLCGARLKPGVTLEAAGARMKAAAENFRRRYPNGMGKEETAGLVSMREFLSGDMRPTLLIIQGAVGFVLLIACANVANLLLARAAAREREMAIRTAIGAGRWRLIRQLLTESILLALGGGAVGSVLGYWGLRLLVSFAPMEIPRFDELAAHTGLDPTVLFFTVLLTLVTGVLFGLAPAIRLSRSDLHTSLKEGAARTTTGVRHNRTRGALVASETALGLVLLVGAGLLIRSAILLGGVQPGFDSAHILTFKTALSAERYGNTAAVAQFSHQLIERLERVPGVRAAGNVINLPTEPGPDLTFRIEGRPASDPGASADEYWRYATPHTFQAMGVPLLRGREFRETDAAKSPAVIIINEAMRRKYWPKSDPLGDRITIGRGMGPEFEDPTREIVGVVGNVRERGLNNDMPPIMYIPQAQVVDALTALGSKILPTAWVVRTSAEPLTLARAVRSEVTAVDSQQAVFDFRSMDQVLEKAMAGRSFILLLLTVFAATALVLAAIGIYGVVSYTVEQRSHEIGIRMALGAGQRDVLGLVMRHGMTLAGIGVAVGLAAAFGLTRVLQALLFGVKASDPITFAGVALVLGLVALLATWIPARRAARVDPITTLRSE